jgi:hypothetical protein
MGVLYNCIEEVGGFFTVVLVDLFFIRRLLNQKFPVIWFYEVYKGTTERITFRGTLCPNLTSLCFSQAHLQ